MEGGARGPFSDWSRWCELRVTGRLALIDPEHADIRAAVKSSALFAEPEHAALASDLKACCCETT